jgi:hypothetical protein
MSAAAAFLTYLWHYLVARMLYDDLLRPLLRGHGTDALVFVCVVIAAFALGRLTRRRA